MLRLSQSPTDPAFVQDPYPFYDRLRAGGDMAFWTEYDMPCAVSHRAVSSLLRDRRFGREIPPELAQSIPDHLAPFYSIESHSMLELEPPRHTRLRGLVTRAFTSRRVAALEPDITRRTHALIDALPKDTADLIPMLCQPLPVEVICTLLGVPDSHARDLLRWSNAMVAIYQARRDRAVEDAASAAAAEFTAFLTDLIAHRRQRPTDDLLTHLIAAEEAGDRLSTEELIATVVLLLNAGHEATVHTLGNGLARLLADGHRVSPENAVQTVEEILRHDPPLHMFTRYAYEDVTVFGHSFKRGDQVALLLGAANRDPDVWPDPHRFDPTRTAQQNTSFGAGLHFCVGAPLARLELTTALPILFDRLPDLRLAKAPSYANLYHFHGLEALHVTY
ncbi:unspecific monooxygenase [Sagittula marina]|uniref:Unspecific monooxygenase n=1 Tax=Sagittula marina TaxID=943940 RepID=A0A7W6DLC6_9RHOB|nr:cytochrome P450 [Sagittula marina]MBB3985103.1 unspecific monooxygenase [Sagittula marina]